MLNEPRVDILCLLKRAPDRVLSNTAWHVCIQANYIWHVCILANYICIVAITVFIGVSVTSIRSVYTISTISFKYILGKVSITI